ncbi:MAG: S8 family peptidase [Steroidobacteraceae bacterium]
MYGYIAAVRIRALARIALLLALVGCASTAQMGASNLAGGNLNANAERLILVTIANQSGAMLSEPGSTPYGYDVVDAYGVSSQARATADALGRDYGLKPVRDWPIAPLGVQCLVFALPPDADRSTVIQRLSADRRVRLAQPMQVFSALGTSNGAPAAAVEPQPPLVMPASFGPDTVGPVSGYNDPYVGLQHGFAAVQAAPAQHWSRGEGVAIAIIDTGVEVDHPDLAGRITATRNFVDDDMAAFGSDRHGTGVAGIIGADANNKLGIVGIAPSARLQIYKACEPLKPHALEAQCNSFTLALALDAAIEAHAQVVNLSLGGPADPLLTQLVVYGLRHGVIFVGAVPEDGRLDGFPVSIPGVIAVDQVGRSAAAATVLHAPGRDILSLAPAGRYDFSSGSSFAAAHVTGAIALLRARVPDLDAATLFAVLARTGMSDAYGERINICAALAAVQPRSDCTHSNKAVATATLKP